MGELVAILSDIHGNIDALRAVLDDLRAKGIARIWCLGDVVGYGPDPVGCLELALSFEFTLMGNHEEALLRGAEDFNARARRALEWTRQRLAEYWASHPESPQRRFLEELPRVVRRENLTFVHGSLRDPTREYVFPRDVFDRSKIQEVFAGVESLCFVGHTHIPGVFTDEPAYCSSFEYFGVYFPDRRRTMINVGSVGQPRDGEPLASYVTWDGESVVFRKVPYDYEAAVARIHQVPELDRFLGDRLREGK